MSNTESVLPRQIDPRKFAQQGACLGGFIALVDLPRLAASLDEQDARITLNIAFGVDDQGMRYMQGEASATLSVICQRCLKPMPYALQADFKLAMLWREAQAVSVDKHWDPWVVGEGVTDIYPVIEDELILSLPLVVYHETLCIEDDAQDDAVTASPPVADNPFQVLSQVKDRFPK
ncbi:MAG: DUF177 domain-containing protein [Cellvibrionaceae bacterium]|nr:DUF177 domain-containing protein [Cellvibrionaceae bacterium]